VTWHRRAACKGRTPEFFPPDQSTGRKWDVVSALRLCRACPVLAECGEDARLYEDGAVIQVRAGCILPEQYDSLPRGVR
jgi:hypothetical protein